MEVTNFRDLGGLKTEDGKTIKHRKLLRSGDLSNLSSQTVNELINDYKLATIVDFRREFEIQQSPDTKIPKAAYINLDILGKMGAKNSSLEDFARLKSIDAVDNHMKEVYTDLILNPGAQEGFKEFMEIIVANKTGSTVFHCFAGKDRTGYAAALILALLGVPEEEIMNDFLLTNTERKQANDQLLDTFRDKGMDEEEIAALSTALYVKPAYLDYAFSLIKDQYETVLNYAEQALDFDKEKVSQLRSLYLEA
ncbi:protein-tyrosine-phosphatase [Carnobacterium divergens]|uniref:Protein tyrosine serine phosphatase n=1 Tax=Carnobacterium divergens DSM 20623 TaxID=1449336 RepID=A0A0R2I6D6_CARDV|nr:tyrosine-protein phosphatase [Carnobacterium divergens]KRN57543.1 protein tyrosine serine phosphatase [Carnobacterium divergens DSM 20623]MDO0875747.1 tyrosine-protein phosphatase [Carnobacterium divergens]MDT2012836.1 tyrosine-protein phosphatase [Carnobacterium divergens]TFJ45582.1 protein-tyrosine-phosphatase [Carnobacterium divergens]TFJ53377.1 protein-tyrosine-phosphatase [Carnobacterium divergens]